MPKILIVDNHPNFVKSLYVGLKSEGFDVETASNGVAAIELAKRIVFDWIVTDIDMPKMQGEEVVAKIREFQPDIKVIFTSSYEMPEGKLPFFYLQKPFLFEELLVFLGPL